MQNFRWWYGGCVTCPVLGDEVEALPGISLNAHGKLYYGAGDLGRVSKDVVATPSDGIRRFEVTWYRTGLTSTMKEDAWIKNFRWIRKIKKTLNLGDVIEALPDVEMSIIDGKQYYKAGDRGRVTKQSKVDKITFEMQFEVTWYRTERKSIIKEEEWLRKFFWIEEKETENALEMWRVTEDFANARVRLGPGYEQTILSVKPAGTVVKGYQVEGYEWVKLADEPGYIAINDKSGQPLLRSQAEEWRVVTHAHRHNIRKETSKNSEVVTTVSQGDKIYGTREGDWLRLSDGSGYSLICEGAQRFLKASFEQPQKSQRLWQQKPSIGSWLMRPVREDEDENKDELLKVFEPVENEDQLANYSFIGKIFTCCVSRGNENNIS